MGAPARSVAVVETSATMQKAGVIAALLFSAFLALAGLESALRGSASRRWPTAKATVLASEVEATVVTKNAPVTSGDKEVRYRPRITYSYSVGGLSFTNQRYEVDEITYSQHRAHSIVRQHPPQREVTVRYRPGSPSYSVIATGSSHRSWAMAVGGICGIGWSIRQWIRLSRGESLESSF